MATAEMLNAANGKSRLGCTVAAKFSRQFSDEVSWMKVDPQAAAAASGEEDITEGGAGQGGGNNGGTTGGSWRSEALPQGSRKPTKDKSRREASRKCGASFLI